MQPQVSEIIQHDVSAWDDPLEQYFNWDSPCWNRSTRESVPKSFRIGKPLAADGRRMVMRSSTASSSDADQYPVKVAIAETSVTISTSS